MSNRYSAEIIKITICGYTFNVHKFIIDSFLVTSNIDNSRFTDIHNYTIDVDNVTEKECEKIVSILYNNLDTNVNGTSREILCCVAFFKKYLKEGIEYEQFDLEKRIIKTLNAFNEWMKTGMTTEKYHDIITDTVVGSAVKLGEEYAFIESFMWRQNECSKYKGLDKLVLQLNPPDLIAKILIELVKKSGISLYDHIANRFNLTKESLIHFGIDIE